MATITTGVDRNFRMGNFTKAETAAFWAAWTEVVRGKGGFLDYCNVSIVGSTRPMTFVGNCYRADVWAISYPRGWGVGSCYFSTHPSVLASWRKSGIDKIARMLWTHEVSWHLWAYTSSQTGNWPITPAMCSRWWQHWPKRVKAAEGEESRCMEFFPDFEKLLQPASLSRWDVLTELKMRMMGQHVVTKFGSLDCER